MYDASSSRLSKVAPEEYCSKLESDNIETTKM